MIFLGSLSKTYIDFSIRLKVLNSYPDASDEASTANWHQDRVYLRQLFYDLYAHSTLTFYYVRVVEAKGKSFDNEYNYNVFVSWLLNRNVSHIVCSYRQIFNIFFA